MFMLTYGHWLRVATAGAWLLFSALSLTAQDDDTLIDDGVRRWIDRQYGERQRELGVRDSVLLKPGLYADRQRRVVEILAVATGVAEGSPVEFFLVGEGGKDYESLAVTPVKPSDIHHALEFIGMHAGRPVDVKHNRFWPKGERVLMSFSWQPKPDQAATRMRVENLLWNTRKKAPLALAGLTFVGSKEYPDPESGKARYEADLLGDVATNFNDPWTVLDIPYRCPQGSRYDAVSVHPEHRLERGQRLTVILEPEYAPERRRVRDLHLSVVSESAAAETAADLAFVLPDADGTAKQKLDFDSVLKVVENSSKAGHDVFLTLDFQASLPLPPVVEFCAMVETLAARDVLRVEPWPDRPYYQAFLPNDAWRDRRRRPSQPVEIKLHRDGEHLNGVLTQLDEQYGQKGRHITATDHAFSSLPGLLRQLERLGKSRSGHVPALFVYAGADVRYGDVLRLYRATCDQVPVVYVFAETGESAAATPAPSPTPGQP